MANDVTSSVGIDAGRQPATESATFSVSRAYSNYILGLLLIVGIFNFVDRQILAILLESIKQEFSFSDTQLGLLGGIAFALFHVVAGIPIAWLADHYSRRNIIAIALGIWSAITALCGLTVGFWSLFLARVGVGIGEAGGGPPSQSLISDYYPPERRGTALAVLGTMFPLGGLAGFLIGGWVTQFYGWRAAFMVVGVPGIILALIVWLTLREPPRGHSEKRQVSGPAPSILSSLKYFSGRTSFIHLCLAAALFSMAAWGGTTWVPAFFIRVHGMSPAAVGTWLALVIGIAGVIGALLGGSITDRVAEAKQDARWYVWIPGVSLLVAVPFAFFTYLWPNPIPALLVMFIPMVLANVFIGPTAAMIMGVAGVQRRAMASALYVLLINLIGMGLGPLAVGIISDIFSADYGVNSLRYSILTLVLVANTWASIHFVLAGKNLREDLRAAEAE
jgi:predicted MFS family arabinose efflux permease